MGNGWSLGILVKMVNVEKCFEIVFAISKNINNFAPKLGLRFNIMALLQFFIFDIYSPGSDAITAGDNISHVLRTTKHGLWATHRY